MSSEDLCSRISTPVAVFDLDGTLYDKRCLALRIVLSQLTNLRLLKAERAVRRNLAGRDFGSEENFYQCFFERLASLAACSHEHAREWYFGSYMPAMVEVLRRRYHLRDWVSPLLETLHERGVRVAVFSDYPFAAEKLEALRFRASWADAGIFDAPSLGGLKPCRESFLRLSSILGALPEDMTVIGDRADTDAEGARCSGMSFVLI